MNNIIFDTCPPYMSVKVDGVETTREVYIERVDVEGESYSFPRYRPKLFDGERLLEYVDGSVEIVRVRS